jgi:hypothetical protein
MDYRHNSNLLDCTSGLLASENPHVSSYLIYYGPSTKALSSEAVLRYTFTVIQLRQDLTVGTLRSGLLPWYSFYAKILCSNKGANINNCCAFASGNRRECTHPSNSFSLLHQSSSSTQASEGELDHRALFCCVGHAT